MQCASFLPGFFSSRDLTVGDNGGLWTLYNAEKILNNVHSRNVFLPMPTKDEISVYEKEVLRQTILQHESIFRDQVRSFHCFRMVFVIAIVEVDLRTRELRLSQTV